VIRQMRFERPRSGRMPLPRAINLRPSTASDFSRNLIISEEPIRVLTLDVAEQVVQRRFARRMPAVAINPRGKKTLQTKTRDPLGNVDPHFAQTPDSFWRRRETGALGKLMRDYT